MMYLLCTYCVPIVYLLCTYCVPNMYLHVPMVYLWCTQYVPLMYLICTLADTDTQTICPSMKKTWIKKSMNAVSI